MGLLLEKNISFIKIFSEEYCEKGIRRGVTEVVLKNISRIIMYYFHPTYEAAVFPKSHNNKVNKKFTSCPHLCLLHTAIMLL